MKKRLICTAGILIIIILGITYFMYERKLGIDSEDIEYMIITMNDEENIKFTLDRQEDINAFSKQLESMRYNKPEYIFGKGYYISINVYKRNPVDSVVLYFTNNNEVILKGVKYKLKDEMKSLLSKTIKEFSNKIVD